jgi:hypothetical protein
MQPNPGSKGGWRCRIRYRAAHNAWVERTGYNGRRVSAGRTYLGHAASVGEAEQINQHVRHRLADFKERQASERKETTDGWYDTAAARTEEMARSA